MDIVRALEIYNRSVPGEWSVGDTYDTLQWFSNPDEKPTEDQINNAWAVYVAEREYNHYKVQRAAEYPAIVDQLDLIYHEGLEAWKEQIKAVKDKYPKPVV